MEPLYNCQHISAHTRLYALCVVSEHQCVVCRSLRLSNAKNQWAGSVGMKKSVCHTHGQFQNSLTTQQDESFSEKSHQRLAQRHAPLLPVSATFSLFKYINISPSISMNDRMCTSKIRRQWDSQASREVMDTTYGFSNLSTSMPLCRSTLKSMVSGNL